MASEKRNNNTTISPRIIKKYPNRRLYDTKYSQYITLDDIHRLVKNERIFRLSMRIMEMT